MTLNWFVQNRVLPYLEPGMVIVLDNYAIHRDPLLRQMVEEAGLELVVSAAIFAGSEPNRADVQCVEAVDKEALL